MRTFMRSAPLRWLQGFRNPRAPRMDPLRLLAEYVLNMSISSLGDQDVTPLFEEYIQDSRLGDPEKAELTAIYRSLRSQSSVASGY